MTDQALQESQDEAPTEASRSVQSAQALSNGPAALCFEPVYDAYLDFAWRSARRLGVDAAGTDDVLQEVFFAVHTGLPRFRGQSSLKTWVFSILLRCVRHYHRTRRRRDPVRAESDPDATVDTRSRGPAESAEILERVRLLDSLLAELDGPKREVFVLAELEEMTAAEIAQVVGTNVHTVYSRLRAAKQAFEAALARHRARESRRPVPSNRQPARRYP
jgi:RNA polymerase sigma-70 factor, ECF subfamily